MKGDWPLLARRRKSAPSGRAASSAGARSVGVMPLQPAPQPGLLRGHPPRRPRAKAAAWPAPAPSTARRQVGRRPARRAAPPGARRAGHQHAASGGIRRPRRWGGLVAAQHIPALAGHVEVALALVGRVQVAQQVGAAHLHLVHDGLEVGGHGGVADREHIGAADAQRARARAWRGAGSSMAIGAEILRRGVGRRFGRCRRHRCGFWLRRAARAGSGLSRPRPRRASPAPPAPPAGQPTRPARACCVPRAVARKAMAGIAQAHPLGASGAANTRSSRPAARAPVPPCPGRASRPSGRRRAVGARARESRAMLVMYPV